MTRLVFSKIKRGWSDYNLLEKFRMQGDVRLAIWDAARGVMDGKRGVFVVDQPEWTRRKYGNWLHSTSYGIHSGIDVFATEHGRPERVLAPIDAVVHSVYAERAPADSRHRIKAVYLESRDPVAPSGEKMVLRFLHLSEIFVAAGQHVAGGDVLGLTGHTGFDPSIGDHLHLEIRLSPSLFGGTRTDVIEETVPVNPYYYLLEWWENSRQRRDGGRGSTPAGASEG
jgi:murein DD-endopeptidase MepM/ murein hydrolase activator NlpD